MKHDLLIRQNGEFFAAHVDFCPEGQREDLDTHDIRSAYGHHHLVGTVADKVCDNQVLNHGLGRAERDCPIERK